jgi:ATP-dependent DNA helicase RecG
MTKAELDRLIKIGEGWTTEFKVSASHLGREMCAFANAGGGHILIGVDDQGRETGVHNVNRLKSQVQATARNLDPSLLIQAEAVGNVLVVTVPCGPDKPYSSGGVFYLREASNTQQLKRDEIREFFFKEGLITFDEQPCHRFKLRQDLDSRKYRDFINRSGIPGGLKRSDVLRNLRVITDEGMTNAGALLFSKRSSDFFLQAAVVCAMFQGTTKATILDKEMFEGNTVSNYERAMAYLSAHLNTEYVIHGGPREEILELPKAALREAVLNAIAHRDYRLTDHVQVHIFLDRVEITNPGGLVAGLKRKDLGHVSRPRNPLLFSLMERMDLVENVGSGIRRIREAMKEYGLDKPIIETGDTWFSITFHRKPQHESVAERMEIAKREGARRARPKKRAEEALTDHQEHIVQAIRNDPRVTGKKLAEQLGISDRAVRKHLEKLKRKGIVARRGSRRGGYWEVGSS